MSVYEESPASSIAPPGWNRADSPVESLAHALQPVLISGQQRTEAAMRWRLRAASLDYLIVYATYLALCAAMGWRVATLGHLVLVGVAVTVYHFVLESRGGQTIGKARYGLRVVSVDDTPATPKAIALRSLLRVIDQLPTCYVSGLISMVRTGPARRQRIGDVVANTKVVAEDGIAADRGTPGWMLPAATVLAVLVSIFYVYGIASAGNRPLSSGQNAQFVAGCNQAIGSYVDCGCLLQRLEADGYGTVNELRSLQAQAQSERLSGRPGTASRELTSVALACKR